MGKDLSGQTLGPFRIESRLGQGAMGTVYRATYLKNGKPAAVKVMSTPGDEPNPTFAARFEREIKLLSQFHHANIVRIYGASEDQGIRYYAMELVEGPTLADILDKRGKIHFARAAAYTIQVCEALQQIHSVGVIHRDLKPGNLLISADHKVKLTDFGIAKDISSHTTRELTQADHTVGTVAYMSPEQLTGDELTRKSDLYSLGIVFYRMLTGRLPFNADTMYEYMNQRARGTFPLPSTVDPSLPREFDALLREMLAQDPKDRPMDAYVVMQRLMDILKRAKEGTLQKTKPQTVAGLAETAVVPTSRFATIVRTVTGGLLARRSDRKARRSARRRESGLPFWERPVVLAASLLVILALIGYQFWPSGPQGLLEEADRLLATDDFHQWQKAVDQYLEPLAANYPSFAQANSVLEKRNQALEEIAKAKARGLANQALILGRRRREASEAEKNYIDALLLEEKVGDKATAQARYKAIVDLFGQDAAQVGWVRLAEERLQKSVAPQASALERLAAKRHAVTEALAKANQLRAGGKRAEALQTYASLEELYAKDGEVADLIRPAVLEFLSPREIFERGQALMQSDQWTDWKEAFDHYFTPLVAKYPGNEFVSKIDMYREKLARALAQQAADAALAAGPTDKAGAAEQSYCLGLFLERQVHDSIGAADCYERAEHAPAADLVSQGFVFLARDRLKELASSREASDTDRRRARLAALRAIDQLEASPPSPATRPWCRPARAFYSANQPSP